MKLFRKIPRASILQLVFVVFAVLCTLSAVGVRAFSYTSSKTLLYNVPTQNDHGCKCHKNRNELRLWACRRKATIRDWRPDGKEPEKIYNFLLEQQKEQERTSRNVFDPEGSLELDVLDRWSLEESYSEEDGGCFLVAATGDGDDDENDGNDSLVIVGTLGMITGTKVTYQSSGSSMSQPEITAAIRRVCVSWPTEYDDDEIFEQSWTKQVSSTSILANLIRSAEERAIEAGATNLIGLAYPEKPENKSIKDYDKGRSFLKPSVDLFQSLGYRVSEEQIPGVKTIQFEKNLSRKELTTKNKADVVKSGAEQWIIPATVVTFFLFGSIIYNLYSNVFGIEQLWGSTDNAGIGTSLSTQNLEELIRDEQLGRSGLDEDIGPGAIRQWSDLSPEELREEQALMKVIQGQSIRSK